MRIQKVFVSIFLLLSWSIPVSAGAGNSCAKDDPLQFIPQEVEAVLPSLVHISAMVYSDGEWQSWGAKGFSFSRERYIMTVAHLLENEQGNIPEDYRIAVYLSDCTMQMAEVVYIRKGSAVLNRDILVLQIPDPPPPIHESPYTLSEIQNTTTFLLDGYPHGTVRKRSGGVFEALFLNAMETEQEKKNLQKTGVFPYIRASTFTQYGDSGSVLFDDRMRALGMIVGRSNEGNGYALHLTQIKDKLKELGLL